MAYLGDALVLDGSKGCIQDRGVFREQGGYEMVRGHDGVAECNIDSLASDGRHRMGGVADQKGAGDAPTLDAIRDRVQEEGLLEFALACSEMGGEFG